MKENNNLFHNLLFFLVLITFYLLWLPYFIKTRQNWHRTCDVLEIEWYNFLYWRNVRDFICNVLWIIKAISIVVESRSCFYFSCQFTITYFIPFHLRVGNWNIETWAVFKLIFLSFSYHLLLRGSFWVRLFFAGQSSYLLSSFGFPYLAASFSLEKGAMMCNVGLVWYISTLISTN